MREPATAEAPTHLYRVARSRGLLSFSTISPVDAMLPTAGNRFDVPGGGVLYAGSDIAACYAETLARMRPTPKIRDLVKDEPGFMVAGGVPQDWRLQRTVGTLTLNKPLPSLDMEQPETHAYLSEVMASDLVALGYTDNLDISDVANSDRRLSRAVAEHAFTATDPDGTPVYSGIRYVSRIKPDWECWAVFEGTEVLEVSRRPIVLTDPDLAAIADLWDLRIF